MTSDVRAALEAGDDGFHEIQLNGKQLVFLGMATTLVSVVIFLCGVLVGRGVKPLDMVAQAAGPQAFDTPVTSSVAPGAIATPAPPATPGPAGAGTGAAAAAAATGSAGDTEPTPLGDEPDPSAPVPATDVAAAAPAKPATVEPKAAPKVEPRETPAPKPAPKPAPVQASATPAPVAPAPKPTPVPVATTAPATSGGQIAVQVGAFATRKEADALAKKLSGRGYAVYVMNPTGDGKKVYRVRVGNYGTADEAQRVSARLTEQENLKPWITR